MYKSKFLQTSAFLLSLSVGLGLTPVSSTSISTLPTFEEVFKAATDTKGAARFKKTTGFTSTTTGTYTKDGLVWTCVLGQSDINGRSSNYNDPDWMIRLGRSMMRTKPTMRLSSGSLSDNDAGKSQSKLSMSWHYTIQTHESELMAWASVPVGSTLTGDTVSWGAPPQVSARHANERPGN